jgi:gluconate 5-dehydrogenase
MKLMPTAGSAFYSGHGSAEEISGPVLFLASPMARFVTGHVLYLDGGRSLI